MAIVLTPGTRATVTTDRVCTACGVAKPITAFPLTQDKRGKHARGQTCTGCIDLVDEHLASGRSEEVTGTLTGAPKDLIRQRYLVHTARASATPATATRVCLACRTAAPVDQFTAMPGTGAPRRVCNSCLTSVDTKLAAKVPVADIIRQTGVTRPTITERRRALGLPEAVTRITPERRQQIIDLAERFDPAEIALELGEKPLNVRRILARHNLIEPNDPRTPVDPAELARAAELLDDGTPYAEVARTTGISVPTLQRHFPGMGATGEYRSLIGWINVTPAVLALHREILRDDPDGTQ